MSSGTGVRADVASVAARRRSWGRCLLLGLPFAAVSLATLAMVAGQPIDHDVAWTLVAGGKLLDGAIYGRDIVDLNLPSIYYVSAAAVALGRLFQIADIHALAGLIIVLACASASLIDRALSSVSGRGGMGFRYPCVISFFAAALLPAASDFGQREQLIFILMAPYVVAVVARGANGAIASGSAVITGVLCGAAILIKPQWALLPLALEAFLAAWTRLRSSLLRPEIVATMAVAMLGTAAIVWLTPLYLSAMVPLALDTYWAYSRGFPAEAVATFLVPVVCLITPALVIAAAHQADRTFQIFAAVILVATLAGSGIWVLQGKYFYYQAMPVRCFAIWLSMVAVCAGLAACTRSALSKRMLALTGVAAATLVLGCSFLYVRWILLADASQARLAALEAAMRRDGPVTSLYALSTAIPDAFPLVNRLGAAWPGRLQCLWPLPAVVRSGPLSPARRTEIGEWVLQAVVDDLTAALPTVVLVETTAEKQALEGLAFEYLPWFMRSPAFREVWGGYDLRGELTVQGKSYQIWRRRDA